MAKLPIPARKPVTAWGTETEYDDDGPFLVLTFHHGLGRMTRLDLSVDDATELAESLTAWVADQ